MPERLAISNAARSLGAQAGAEGAILRRIHAGIGMSVGASPSAGGRSEERATFERALSTARIGIWECDLATESLRWTDSVYELFDLPYGAVIARRETLGFYERRSLATLERVRAQAIGERRGFALDAEIVTARGRRRWIRVTATIDCEGGRPTRIFGTKQDVTEERETTDRIRRMAEIDAMTGLANRSVFEARLATYCETGAHARPRSLLIVDLDGFKRINDTYGHALGDACLTTAAARLRSACDDGAFPARIGGDEFAVLTDSPAPASLARRIVRALRPQIEIDGKRLNLGASVGIATSDGCPPAELFSRADMALYAAKAAGRNTFRAFGAMTPRRGRGRAG